MLNPNIEIKKWFYTNLTSASGLVVYDGFAPEGAGNEYIVIIGFGAVMLCVIGYFLFSELFTRETPSGIYDESSKICLDNFQV